MILDPNSLAEEITRGAKETAALVAKLDRAAAAERDALAAEVERLRAALELIADTDPDEGTAWFHDVANAALAERPEGQEVGG